MVSTRLRFPLLLVALSIAMAIAADVMARYEVLFSRWRPFIGSVECPGTLVVDVPAAGEYLLYEARRRADGWKHRGRVRDFRFIVRTEGDDDVIRLQRIHAHRYWGAAGYGRAVYQFTVSRAGPIVMTATRATESSGTCPIAIGRAVDVSRFRGRSCATLLLLLGGIAAFALVPAAVLATRALAPWRADG